MPDITNEQEITYYSAIYGDQNRFLQVIINFLSNSLKFSPTDSKIKVQLKMLENQTLKIGDKQMKKMTSEKCKKIAKNQYSKYKYLL